MLQIKAKMPSSKYSSTQAPFNRFSTFYLCNPKKKKKKNHQSIVNISTLIQLVINCIPGIYISPPEVEVYGILMNNQYATWSGQMINWSQLGKSGNQSGAIPSPQSIDNLKFSWYFFVAVVHVEEQFQQVATQTNPSSSSFWPSKNYRWSQPHPRALDCTCQTQVCVVLHWACPPSPKVFFTFVI